MTPVYCNGADKISSIPDNTNLLLTNKVDTRRFGFTLNYKIPTKNKLAKEIPNILNKEKKEDNGNVIGN